MKNTYFIFFILLSMCMIQCKSADGITGFQETVKPADHTEAANTYVSLTELLRTKAGVMVRGTGKNATIKVRTGATSFSGDSSPLFVLNGQVVNGGYSNLYDMVFVPDIKKVKVLADPADLTFYGTRAANGVIEIETKR